MWRLVVVAWTARTSWLAASYVLGSEGVARHHVETAAFVLAALLIVPAIGGAWQWAGPAYPGSPWQPRLTTLAVLLVLAFALYWPVLDVGLLSDDFVLLTWARTGTFVDDSWELVRPVPLLLWHALDRLFGPHVAVAIHATNVLLHAVNGALVAILAERMGLSSARALAAGLLFVVFPLSVEPVVWSAGVFDVLMTTCVLGAVLAGTSARSRRRSVAVVVLLAVALGTKETAAVAPVLVALMAWYTGGRRRLDCAPAITAAATVAVYLVWRIGRGLPAAFPPLTAYGAKELLSRPIGALALPFHTDAVALLSAGAALTAAAVPMLFVVRTFAPGTRQLVMWSVGWMYVSVAPLFTILFVGPDLQGARYLYLPAVAWAVLIAAAPRRMPPARRVAEGVVIGAALLLFAVAVRVHLRPWIEASQTRDAVISAIEARAARCQLVGVAVPDHVRGAYVFRNGLDEALRLGSTSVRLARPGATDVPGECVVPPLP